MRDATRRRTRRFALLAAAAACAVVFAACGDGADTPEPTAPTTTSESVTSGGNQLIPVDRARSVADQMNDRSATLTTP